MFQSFNLPARTSAIENVGLPLYYTASGPLGRIARTERARKALQFVGLGDRERNTPGQLSGGQQQRVAIARALINGPSLLLADEPTGNLDTRTSHELMDMLASLNREQGVTIILVTHEFDIAAYADRIVTMRDGAIVSDKHIVKPAVSPFSAERGRVTGLPSVTTRSRTAGAGGFLPFALMILGAAAQAVGRNKMRSALTMLGIFIGVAALIVMVAIGDGGFGSASTLTNADARAIRHDDPAVSQVGYLIRQQGQVQYGNQNWTTTIQGVSANYPRITNWHIAVGRGISANDENKAALVVVIGQPPYRQLFNPGESPPRCRNRSKGRSTDGDRCAGH